MLSHLITLTLIAVGSAIGATPPQTAEEIEGTWIEQVPEPRRIGKVVKRDPETLVIRGNLYVSKVGEREMRQSLLRVIPGNGLKGIDLMTVVGDEFWLSRAIYKVEKDQLTICEAVKDEERPSEFRSGLGLLPGERFTLLRTYKRVQQTGSHTPAASTVPGGNRAITSAGR